MENDATNSVCCLQVSHSRAEHIRFWAICTDTTIHQPRLTILRMHEQQMHGIVLTNILLPDLPKPWSFHFDVDCRWYAHRQHHAPRRTLSNFHSNTYFFFGRGWKSVYTSTIHRMHLCWWRFWNLERKMRQAKLSTDWEVNKQTNKPKKKERESLVGHR